ncbi:MAG: DHH family phosphoesterase, partial [Anaerovoracaceae bacterium]
MTTRNNSLAEIGRALIKAETVLIFPHILMDGDALGSSVALCRALRNSGKNCHVLIEDRVPGYISFLDKGYCTDDQAVLQEPADVCICVDCGEESRFPGRVQVYREGKTKICIDHHPTSMGIGDLNYIEQGAAATGELIYALLEEMNIELDKEIAEAIYTTIMTDTGNFRYSNTRKRSH